MKSLRNMLMAASAMVLLAGCISDSVGSSSGGGGGGTTSASVPQLGVTGDGGVTSALGLSSVTDPLLGTTGLLGGGSSDGAIGGAIPTDSLAPLASALEPATSALAPVTSAVDTGLASVPQLGVTGDGGVLDSLIGTDPLTPVVGTDGAVADLLGGGSSGALGSIIPAGTLPTGTLPTGDVSQVVDEVSTIANDQLSGLSSGDNTAALSNILSAVSTDPAGTAQSLVSIAGSLVGGAGSGGDPVSGVVGTVTSVLPSDTAGVVESVTTPVTTALAPVTSSVTSALSPVLSAVPVP